YGKNFLMTHGHARVRLTRLKSAEGDYQEFRARGGFRHNLSPKTTLLASNHSRGGRFHSSAALFKTNYSSFIAASSFGKCPLVRTARRSFAFSASIAFVV